MAAGLRPGQLNQSAGPGKGLPPAQHARWRVVRQISPPVYIGAPPRVEFP